MSTKGNSNYNQIRSSGTPGASTPNFIARAGTIGPVGEPNQNPYDVVDVNCDVSTLTSGVFNNFVIGTPFTPGCIITQASIDGQHSFTPQSISARLGYVFIQRGSDNVTDGSGFTPLTPSTPAGTLDTEDQTKFNAGYNTNKSNLFNTLIPFPPSGFDVIPALQFLSSGNRTGHIHAKIVSYCQNGSSRSAFECREVQL